MDLLDLYETLCRIPLICDSEGEAFGTYPRNLLRIKRFYRILRILDLVKADKRYPMRLPIRLVCGYLDLHDLPILSKEPQQCLLANILIQVRHIEIRGPGRRGSRVRDLEDLPVDTEPIECHYRLLCVLGPLIGNKAVPEAEAVSLALDDLAAPDAAVGREELHEACVVHVLGEVVDDEVSVGLLRLVVIINVATTIVVEVVDMGDMKQVLMTEVLGGGLMVM